jgi:addiction module HigA family antidote
MGQMFNRPHPSEILSGKWMKPMGLSSTAVAQRLRMSRKTLSEIVNGKSSISPEMALRLELAFGKSAASWLGRQDS